MARRQPRWVSCLTRRRPSRNSYDRVLIVCEGAKTEPIYFSELKDYYRLSNANIRITPADGTDPLSILHTAQRLQKDENMQGERYDRVYCVFDRDEHANFDTACQKIQNSDLEPARSWPCFEFWLLLHFRYTREPFARTGNHSPGENCVRALRHEDSMQHYRKARLGLFAQLLERLETAKQHAKRSRQDALETGEDNPSTEIHELVEYLQHLKDPV